MIKKLISIAEWQKQRFEGKAPTSTCIARWCREGFIPAKKIGGLWFIDAEAEAIQSGNELVDSVLKS
ncbi:DNA-binding protein [Zooshikella marina]|uniref:DNA-binding protein n=1 Tax=Zooshikella ganghwensis TaxID=202772 RepID=UPI001BB0B178|nr:DNA-binding protein [Zooshikella ganghwensis]MBU2707687.1 DNA-binding protein [Zooshikella ganghwensis]